MSRKPRKKSESQIYHVILRGNNRQSIFFNDADRFFIINRIQKYSEQTNIELYAYCLMDNHIHLLVGKANPNLSKFVQKLAT
ncbi:MAG: transposase, partial [Treponema sp.]|nr:transposase [Treponema sp.]